MATRPSTPVVGKLSSAPGGLVGIAATSRYKLHPQNSGGLLRCNAERHFGSSETPRMASAVSQRPFRHVSSAEQASNRGLLYATQESAHWYWTGMRPLPFQSRSCTKWQAPRRTNPFQIQDPPQGLGTAKSTVCLLVSSKRRNIIYLFLSGQTLGTLLFIFSQKFAVMRVCA